VNFGKDLFYFGRVKHIFLTYLLLLQQNWLKSQFHVSMSANLYDLFLKHQHQFILFNIVSIKLFYIVPFVFYIVFNSIQGEILMGRNNSGAELNGNRFKK
jgi:hypothetical protein